MYPQAKWKVFLTHGMTLQNPAQAFLHVARVALTWTLSRRWMSAGCRIICFHPVLYLRLQNGTARHSKGNFNIQRLPLNKAVETAAKFERVQLNLVMAFSVPVKLNKRRVYL